ncbi:unnamed protein product [Paramecium primaurelia]|uniref:WD40-repeat-containing domain n=1 Tax=Paramecium primaurelia TaxID=5886 RepID=A0A8S1QPT4_PARPR|nr:unnamed protein product [Paramecium primaurelia]
MFKPKMIENEKDFKCSKGHKLQIVTIALDPKLSRNQRLLCKECLENIELDAKVVGLRTIISLIEENQGKKLEKIQNVIMNEINLIEQLHGIVDQMKSFVIQQFTELITIIMEWIQSLKQQGSQFTQYSFYEELEIMILKQNKTDDNLPILINEIQKTNLCWISKFNPKLDYFNQLLEYNKCQEILSNVNLGSQNNTQNKQQQQFRGGEIKLKLIDQSVKQSERCDGIAFDSSGSIMLSTQQNDIKVWSFQNGTIKLIKTLQGHTKWIQCLIYSKKQNSFISGDVTIRCWKQQDSTKWISSQPYEEHKLFVKCLLLNSNEDLLFSGSDDESIKVWKVDFNKNILKYIYSLNKHEGYVLALSLNYSETQLVSCAKGKNQIIIWERKEQDKYEFKYFVKQSIQEQGKKVRFIKENQFIWVTSCKEIDKFYVFELKEGVFQEIQEKTIDLVTNNQILDECRFPIMYNKDKNLIIIRHKTYFYIIREMNNGNFKIVDQFNCDSYSIYGNMTNNGQYLVYWDDKKKGYSIYELSNK